MATTTQTARHTTARRRDDRDVAPAVAGPTVILARIVWFLASLLLLLLAVRFIFSLLGANRGNGFANFIYSASHPFVAPFFGLFHYNVVDYGASRFEVYTLVAMLVYGAIAWLIAYLVTIPSRY
jgi:hypothetical protein